MCKFENISKMPKFGNFVMILISVENAYKVFVLKIFQNSVCVKRDVFMSRRLKAIYLLISLSRYFPLPLDSVVLLLVSRNPYHWMFEGHAWVIIQS